MQSLSLLVEQAFWCAAHCANRRSSCQAHSSGPPNSGLNKAEAWRLRTRRSARSLRPCDRNGVFYTRSIVELRFHCERLRGLVSDCTHSFRRSALRNRSVAEWFLDGSGSVPPNAALGVVYARTTGRNTREKRAMTTCAAKQPQIGARLPVVDTSNAPGKLPSCGSGRTSAHRLRWDVPTLQPGCKLPRLCSRWANDRVIVLSARLIVSTTTPAGMLIACASGLRYCK